VQSIFFLLLESAPSVPNNSAPFPSSSTSVPLPLPIPLNGLVRPSSSKHQMHDLRCLGKRGVPAIGSCSCRTDQVWWCHCCRRGERRGGRGRWGWRILVLGFLGVSPSIQSSSLSSDGSTDGEGSGTTKISLGSSSPSSSPS
jgi:hypothetical protein